MNFVRDADAQGVRDVRELLRVRMGHQSFEVTQRYLIYDENNARVETVSAFHHDRLYRLNEGERS